MTGWGMYRLSNLIGHFGVERHMPDGRWVRAVPAPYHASIFERLKPALLVLIGKAYAIEWPKDGELEDALRRGNGNQ